MHYVVTGCFWSPWQWLESWWWYSVSEIFSVTQDLSAADTGYIFWWPDFSWCFTTAAVIINCEAGNCTMSLTLSLSLLITFHIHSRSKATCLIIRIFRDCCVWIPFKKFGTLYEKMIISVIVNKLRSCFCWKDVSETWHMYFTSGYNPLWSFKYATVSGHRWLILYAELFLCGWWNYSSLFTSTWISFVISRQNITTDVRSARTKNSS